MYLKSMKLRSWEEILQISKKLQKSFTNKLTSFNLTISFTSPGRVINFFAFKDNVPKILLLGLFYNCKWDGCNATFMVRPAVILKSEFMIISTFHISMEKMWRLTKTS